MVNEKINARGETNENKLAEHRDDVVVKNGFNLVGIARRDVGDGPASLFSDLDVLVLGGWWWWWEEWRGGGGLRQTNRVREKHFDLREHPKMDKDICLHVIACCNVSCNIEK